MDTEKKSISRHKSVPERIDACEKVLTGAGKPDMLALLSPYVTEDTLAPGLHELQETQALERQQRKQVKGVEAAFDKFQSEFGACDAALKATRSLAKVLGRHYPEVLNEMGISRSLPRKQVAWMNAALEFYEEALERDDLIAEVETRGLTRARLETEYQRVQTLKPLYQAATDLDAIKQQSTKDRDARLVVLEDQCLEILALAEVALNEKGKPQLLERLGKVVK